jgi:hypothetical protein
MDETKKVVDEKLFVVEPQAPDTYPVSTPIFL